MRSEYAVADFNTYDRRYHSTYNRKCFDGTITGVGKCVGYCEYNEHPGFINEALEKKHRCVEKNCSYFIPKQKNKVLGRAKSNGDEDEMISIASKETSDMEGLRVMRASKNDAGEWTVYYIAIAEYSLREAADRIERQLCKKIGFSKLPYKYEIAANLIFGVELSA